MFSGLVPKYIVIVSEFIETENTVKKLSLQGFNSSDSENLIL